MSEKRQARVIIEDEGVEVATFTEEYSEIQYPEEFKVNSPDTVSKSVVDEIRNENNEYNKEKLKDALATTDLDLEGLLDSYDPAFPGYTPSERAFDFFNLMRLVEGGDFEFDTPIAHYFMADLLLGEITDSSVFPYNDNIKEVVSVNTLRLAFMCSRGMAKSSVVISFFGVYSAIKGELPNGIGKVWFYLVLAASSRGGARVNALAVRAMCEESQFLLDYFEEMRFTETESEFVRRCPSGKVGKEAKVPRKNRSFLIRYQGVGTGVRGIRYGQRRICHIILDDIILNEAAAYSKTITENLESVIHSDAVAALKGGGKGRITNCFTPFSYSDVNTRLVLSGAYTPCVIPIANTFNAESDKLTIKNVTSSWESYHPSRSILDLVRDAKKTKTLSKFMQERMLRLSSGADRLVPDSCIQWNNAELIRKNIHAYNVYITSDFTTTSGEKSDFSGIACWALSNNGDWFMLELALRKMGMAEQYRTMLDWAAKYTRMDKHVELGVEVDGNQQAHIFSLEKIMAERGQWYTFARQRNADKDSNRKGILSRNGGGSKIERFRIAVNNYMLTRKLWFAEELKDTPDMVEMIKQIKGATHKAFTRSDDGPDLISMLWQLSVVEPTEGSYASEATKGYTRSVYGDFEFDEEDEVYGRSTIF